MNKAPWPSPGLPLTRIVARKRDASEIVPFTDQDHLTWDRVKEGCDASRWAFHAFWYLFAITAKHEFFKLAAEVAKQCPLERRTFAFSVKIHSPLPDHNRYVRMYQNPTGINLWFELLELLPKFGLFEKKMIQQSGAVPHFNPQLFSERRLGETRTLTKVLLNSSPWPTATWISATRSEGGLSVLDYSETNGQQALPGLRPKFRGVERIVTLPNGSIIRSFLEPPGQQTYG